eukprot:scaffold14163_cov51-Attheya_sp.AAC.5
MTKRNTKATKNKTIKAGHTIVKSNSMGGKVSAKRQARYIVSQQGKDQRETERKKRKEDFSDRDELSHMQRRDLLSKNQKGRKNLYLMRN